MNDYTVPYHMHNDFLQIFAETGVIGFILYIGIFGYLAFNIIFKTFRSGFKLEFVILFSCLLIYIIDANLNFPHERSEIHSIFPLILGLIIYFEKN